MKRFVILGHVGCGARHLQTVLSRCPGAALPPQPALFSLLDLAPALAQRAILDPSGYLQTAYRSLSARRPAPRAGGFTMHYSDGADSLDNGAAIADTVRQHLDPHAAKRRAIAAALVRKHGGMPAVSSRFFTLWRGLHGDRDLHVIHLRRANRLQAFLESLAFLRCDPRQQFHIEPVLFHGFEAELQGHSRYVRQQFDRQPFFEAYYEDFAPGNEVASGLAAFLDLPDFAWEPDSDAAPHPRAWLSNYDQWVYAFRDTPWQSQMEAIHAAA